MITGEYWIIDGAPLYADGDVGATNHEALALDYLRREILEALGIDTDFYDWARLHARIWEELLSRFGASDLSVPDRLRTCATDLALNAEDISYAFEEYRTDIRAHMAKTRGWIAVWRDSVSVWHLTRDTVKSLVEGINRVLDEEGFEEEGDFEIMIRVGSTRETYETTLQRLENEDWSDLPIERTEPPTGPNAQVAALDRSLEHPYYQQHGQ